MFQEGIQEEEYSLLMKAILNRNVLGLNRKLQARQIWAYASRDGALTVHGDRAR